MRAVIVTEHGDRDVLKRVADHPEPTPGPDEVIVEVQACAVNPHDIFSRRGMPGIRIPLPLVTGSDIAGTISAIGSNVQDWRLGDRVLVDPIYDRPKGGLAMIGERRDGGRAERVGVPAANLIALPSEVGFDEAAALPLAYGTAHRMLFSRGQVAQGDRILVLGASGGVGIACVQLLQLVGVRVIACTSSPFKAERLRALGVEDVFDGERCGLAKTIHKTCGKPRIDGSGGVDVAINFIGGSTWADTQKCVKKGGQILTCGASAGYEAMTDLRYLWALEHDMVGSDGWVRADLQALVALVAHGLIRPVIDDILPLEHAAEAERRLEEREAFGKIILQP